MAVECSSSLKRRLALGAAVALLGGCVVAPATPYEVGAPVAYSSAVYVAYPDGVYHGGPVYYYGAPVYSYGGPVYYYYGAPVYRPYWRPAVSLSIWGGRHGRGRPGHRGFRRR